MQNKAENEFGRDQNVMVAATDLIFFRQIHNIANNSIHKFIIIIIRIKCFGE